MWNVINFPPQPFGECSICKKHDCGEYKDEEGSIQQKWLYFVGNVEDKDIKDLRDKMVLGYKCVESMSAEMGITLKVREVERQLEPTDEHIVSYIRRSIDRQPVAAGTDPLQANIDYINGLDKAQLKAYLAEQKVEFAPQMGEDKLRQLAISHIQGAKL